MNKGLYALSFGTLGLGVAEYVMMGILSAVAADLGISIPTAGHLISAYAVGVCVGAPLLVVVARRWPLRNILCLLVGVYIAGNLMAAVSPSYGALLGARFVSGLPHGGFFGVGSIVAGRLAREGHGTQAVAIMVAGMTVANMIGVPVGTVLAQTVSWRTIFLFSALWGAVTMWCIRRWVPELDPLPDNGLRGQFRFLRHLAPWLLVVATMCGNGGIFCWYSYIDPTMMYVAGFSAMDLKWLMVLAGAGMCVGNLLGGVFSDRFTPERVVVWIEVLAAVSLLLTFFFARIGWASVVLMCCGTGALFAVSPPLQVLLLRNAPGGEMMGAACVQVAFNLGNALGAYFGGLPIAAGLGYEYPALIGCIFTLVGVGSLVWFYRRSRPLSA